MMDYSCVCNTSQSQFSVGEINSALERLDISGRALLVSGQRGGMSISPSHSGGAIIFLQSIGGRRL
jgi:hypothetical protein